MNLFKLLNKTISCFLFMILIFTHFNVTADESRPTEAGTNLDECCTKNLADGNVTDPRPGDHYTDGLRNAGLPVRSDPKRTGKGTDSGEAQ